MVFRKNYKEIEKKTSISIEKKSVRINNYYRVEFFVTCERSKIAASFLAHPLRFPTFHFVFIRINGFSIVTSSFRLK